MRNYQTLQVLKVFKGEVDMIGGFIKDCLGQGNLKEAIEWANELKALWAIQSEFANKTTIITWPINMTTKQPFVSSSAASHPLNRARMNFIRLAVEKLQPQFRKNSIEFSL